MLLICASLVILRASRAFANEDANPVVKTPVVFGLAAYRTEQFSHHELNKDLSDTAGHGLATETRKKRVVGSMLAQGALALRKLLDGTRSIFSKGKKYRNHLKTGNYFQAMKDFESVNPHGVTERFTNTGAKITEGWIGDRKLKLRSKSSYGGSTVLDIIDFNYKKANPGKPFIDRIIYEGWLLDENEPRDHLTTVSYSKEKDEAVILQGGGNKSAPPSKEVTSDHFLQKLYPCLPKVFSEYCLKHTWGSIVWMQPTSVCDFGGCSRLRRAFVKNDATDFVICDRK